MMGAIVLEAGERYKERQGVPGCRREDSPLRGCQGRVRPGRGGVGALSAEKEKSPMFHSRAALEDDVDEEQRLKQRFQDISSERVVSEDKRNNFEAGVSRLCPNDLKHRNDPTIHH